MPGIALLFSGGCVERESDRRNRLLGDIFLFRPARSPSLQYDGSLSSIFLFQNYEQAVDMKEEGRPSQKPGAERLPTPSLLCALASLLGGRGILTIAACSSCSANLFCKHWPGDDFTFRGGTLGGLAGLFLPAGRKEDFRSGLGLLFCGLDWGVGLEGKEGYDMCQP